MFGHAILVLLVFSRIVGAVTDLKVAKGKLVHQSPVRNALRHSIHGRLHSYHSNYHHEHIRSYNEPTFPSLGFPGLISNSATISVMSDKNLSATPGLT